MVQWLKALAALLEDLSSISSTHPHGSSQLSVTLVPIASDILFWSPGHQAHGAQAYMQVKTLIYKFLIKILYPEFNLTRKASFKSHVRHSGTHS